MSKQRVAFALVFIKEMEVEDENSLQVAEDYAKDLLPTGHTDGAYYIGRSETYIDDGHCLNHLLTRLMSMIRKKKGKKS